MVPVTIPEGGLTLAQEPMSATDNGREGKIPQIMQLDLEPSVLRDILKCARHGGKSVNITLGKAIVSRHSTRFTATSSYLTILLGSSLR